MVASRAGSMRLRHRLLRSVNCQACHREGSASWAAWELSVICRVAVLSGFYVHAPVAWTKVR